jgi:hypothetical protein
MASGSCYSQQNLRMPVAVISLFAFFILSVPGVGSVAYCLLCLVHMGSACCR